MKPKNGINSDSLSPVWYETITSPSSPNEG